MGERKRKTSMTTIEIRRKLTPIATLHCLPDIMSIQYE